MSFIFKTVLRRVKSINKFSFHDVWNSNSKFYVTSKITLTNTLLKIKNGPDLKDFLNDEHSKAVKAAKLSEISDENQYVPYLNPIEYYGNGRKVFFEVFGCQMNVNDTEIIWSILKQNGYTKVNDINESDVVLVITCAIREGAEEKIWNRLKHLNALKKKRSVKKGSFQIGILGCMAERLKHKLLEEERSVDLVAGPDSYKDLPRLLSITQNGQSAINVLLSLDETYADIMPVRLNHDNVTAFVSIMRGCDNMCSYCIVPFTRGRERSRPLKTIVNEVKILAEQGIKDITLLGQNVNSYRDLSSDSERIKKTEIVSGFKTVYKPKIGGQRFDELLKCVAEAVPEVRIRFTSPHPKDFSDNVLNVIKTYPNICKSLHLPAQSGNSNVLERMRRGYTRESYIDLISHVKSFIPNVALSSDFICGFCGETDEEFADTLSLINEVKYNVAYLFAYSMREKTTAHRRYKDDISEEVKINRLMEMSNIFRKTATELQSKYVGRTELILVENTSKRLKSEMYGRNDGNIKVIIPTMEIPSSYNDFKEETLKEKIIQPGDFICVKINESSSQVLKGEPLFHTTFSEYHTKIVDNL